MRLAVLISGSGSNLQAILDSAALTEAGVETVVVLSNVAGAYGLQRALARNIPTVVVSHKDFDSREAFDAEVIRSLKPFEPDLVALAGYMRIVTPKFINAFPGRVMNIHPALLPSFPGLHGQKQALDYGVKIAGATVHFVTPEMDSGPIIIQAAVPVREDDTEDILAARILEAEHAIYPEAIRLFAEGRLDIDGRRVIVKDGKPTTHTALANPTPRKGHPFD